jgi:hypothetical protein
LGDQVTPGDADIPRLRHPAAGDQEDIRMQDLRKFLNCWRRVVLDAGSDALEMRGMDGQALKAAESPSCAMARQILAEALCLPQSAFCAGTRLASLEMDSLILETIALHAEEITGREYDRLGV